jgi:hypothetical protein
VYFGHASWVAIVVFGAMFAMRALSSQRRRGNRSGGRLPKSGFTADQGVADRQPPSQAGGNGSQPTGTTTGTPPGWFRDPFFRHERRFWSGTEWTEHISDGDVPGSDPPPGSKGPEAG